MHLQNEQCSMYRSYGCDECQNTGASPPPSAFNDKDDDDEQLWQPDKFTEEEIEKLEESIQKIEKLEEYDPWTW